MRCQNCGADLENGVSFCKECGSKVNKKFFCRECGDEVASGVRFCSNCGADMSLVEEFAAKSDKHEVTTHNYDMQSKRNNTTNKSRAAKRTTLSQKIPNNHLGNYIQKQVDNNNTVVVAATIVAVVAILLIGLIALVSGKIKKVANSMDLIPTFISTQTSDFTIELDTKYAYMSDEWDVYIAEAVTESVIKIERWNKTSSSDKKVKFRDELGSFKINDSENGFAWIDDDHTAFTFNLVDKNNSRVKGQTVVFTININDGDENKGSDYSPQIACYSYQNDDWHNYRAIPLTEDLVKIETWHRGSSSGKFLFGYDMCVLNIKSDDTDFEMNSDKTAFTITIIDQDNDSYWKEKKFVSFTLEDADYQYPDVWSYRDASIAHEGEIAISSGASTYKYKNYHEVQSMLENEGLTNISTVILYDIIWGWTSEGEVDSVSIDGNNIFNAGDIFKADAPVIITYHMKYEDNPDNTTNDVQETQVSQDVTANSKEEAVLEIEEENPLVEDAIDNHANMPIMYGTSWKAAASVAKQYGVVEKYDDDFEHGTRCKAFINSTGGLMLDVIYVTDTDEIMSASITTNKLASIQDQKAFVKALSAVLCPSADSSDISSWVSSNVGGSKSTNVGGFTYEVSLGPAQNVLYNAGTEEWEEWESQYW